MKTNATSIRQLTHLLLTTTIVLFSYSAKAQCDDITPSFNVDLSANPYMTWTSPLVQRDGNCCGTTNPDKCLEFIITLHPDAASLVFTISDGAVPPGALFYQIDCGPAIAVGSPICLNGTGPFHLTFCKPGNNENAFTIETIPNPMFGPDISLNNGCEGLLYGLFYDESSITWTSVSPGAPGAYNSYLDCVSGCDTVHPVGQPGAPAVVEYIVCGMAANGCTTEPICDTQRVTFIPPIVASINAPDTHLCYNETTLPATASATGGTPPYTYSWNTGETTPGINAGVGSHTVTVNDQSGCGAATATVVITQSLLPVVNAGATINQCAGDPSAINITGTASNTSAVIWSSVGGGTFGNATALSTTFTPTAAQVASGSFTLTLTSNDVSGCPPVSSSVTVNYQPVFQSAIVTPVPVSCFGGTNGSVSVAVNGTGGPYTYAFDGGAAGATSTASGLAAGTHTVTITSALGCDSTLTFTINTPTLLVANPLAPVNVSCNGGTNGQASVAVSGGTSPYQYSWNTVPAQTASTATGLAAGTYTVSVTDQNGCTATTSVTITQPTPVSVSLAAVPPGCNGSTNGTVTATPAGGTPGYNYSWNTGATGAILSNVGAGNYSVTMTDANGCPATANTTVNQPTVLVATASNDVTVCPGAPAPLSVNATGGTAPYSYAWTPGGQTGAAVNVTTMVDQQFSVTVTDANGCTATDQVMVTTYTLDPADFTLTVSDDEVCPGTTVTLTAAYAGTEPATISWAHCGGCPAVTTDTPAATTTYTVTVTNLCGQTTSLPVTVTVNTIPTVSISAPDTELCYNETTLAVTAVGAGGEAPYTYSWSNGATSALANVGPGTQTVTISDINNCGTAQASVIITQTLMPVVNANAVAPLCAGTAGAISISGTASNTSAVIWSGGQGVFGNASSLSTTYTPTAAETAVGSIVLTLTSNDISGCAPVSANTTITFQPVSQQISLTTQDVTCFGGADGSVAVNVTGAYGPYTYSYNGATPTASSTTGGMTAGTHMVTVSSAIGCDTTLTFVINQPTALVLAMPLQQGVSCNAGSDGSAMVAATGGSPAYQYLWATTPAQTTQTATGLAAGNYSVTVTDSQGCTAVAGAVITEPTPVTVTLAPVSPACFGSTNGSVTATPAGGTPGYNYSWNTGVTGAILSNVGAGNYSVTMTDANGCPATANTTVNQPAALVATASNDVTVCPGAPTPLSVNATGGTAPYSYVWTPGGQTGAAVSVTTAVDQQFSVTVTDANGCTATDQVMVTTYTLDPADFTVTVSDNEVCAGTLVTLTAAYAGTEAATITWAHCGACPAVTTATPMVTTTYTATVTNLCGQTASLPVTVTVNTVPTVSINAPDTQLCYNETTLAVTAVGAGGEAPYSYSWSNGSTGAVANVGPGVQTVTITDINNCGTAQADVTITQTLMPVVNANAVAPLCAGTAGAINISGTASNTSAVIWSGGQGVFGNASSLSTTYTPTAAETAVGSIVLTLTSNDISGCAPVSANTTITFQPVSQQISLTTQDVTCFGGADGSVAVNVTGVYGPYTYSYNGATPVASNTDGALAAGTYTVTVYSAIGCDTTLTYTIATPPLLSVTMPLQQGVSCFGGSNGQAMVGVTGGVAPYQYLWSTTPAQTTQTATGLAPGNYTVTVTDAHGCDAMTGAVISEPTQLAVTLSAVPPSCYGSANGSVTANPTGGTPGYSYNWNNATTGTTMYNLGAGSYAVTVTDANGCIANANTTVGQPAIIVVSASNDVTVCPGTPVPLSVTASGGEGNYTYLWTPGGQTTAAVTVSTPVDQLYTVSVTDANGCVATAQVMITTYTMDPADLTVAVSDDAVCDGMAVTLTAAYAGTEQATISWQHCPTCPAVTQDTPNGTTTYTATVTNLCGQTASAQVTVVVNYPPQAAINAPDIILCHNETSLPATAIGIGGTAPYTFSWSNGATTDATLLPVGTHTVDVTDVNNCGVAQANVTITQLPAPQVQAGADMDLCAGFIGPVTVTASASNTSDVLWTGGAGSFANPTALSTQYFPSDDEVAGNEVNLVIVSNDSSGCPPVSDVVQLDYNYVTDQVVITPVGVSCFGQTDGSVSIVMNGPNPPYTFAFDGGAQGMATSASNLAAGTHSITIYNALGCDSTLQFQVPTPQPLVAGSTVLENVSCFGGSDGSVIATATGGTAPYQYSWSSTPAQQNAQASGIPAGAYTVTLTDNNGCISTSTLAVTQPPQLTVSLSFVPPNCNGLSNGAVTASVGGGAGGYGYFWNTGAQSTSIYNIPAGAYTITVADANGCTVIGAVTVTEPPLLTAIASNDTTVCPNSPASLQVTSNGGTGTYSYQWTPGGQTTAAVTVTPATDLLYTVIVTDNNGCTASDDVQVTTESMNPADISIASSGTSICAPAQVQLTAVYGGSDPSVQLSWLHCSTCPATITETPNQTTTYVAQAMNYCSQVITDSITITVNFPPQLDLDSLLGELCPYEMMEFINNGDNDPSWSYNWSFGDGATSTLSSPYHYYTEHGNYNVSLTVTDDNGCQSTLDNGGIVVVHPSAVADFNASSLTESLLEPHFDFVNTSSNATSYLWDLGDGTMSTSLNVSHTYAAYGEYVVELVANNYYNCPDSVHVTINVTPSFDIYVPNAFTPDGDSYNNTFMVKGYGLIEKDFSMEIYDRWGELIFHSTDINVGWDGTTKAGERASQDGVYTWVIYFRDLTDSPHRIEGHVTILR